MAIYRTENALVLWQVDPEALKTSGGIYGLVDTSSTGNSSPKFRFGLHETVQAPDPEIEWTPMYGPGSDRSRQNIFAGKWSLKGSVPDIRVQPGCGGSTTEGGLADLLTLVLGKKTSITIGTGSGWKISENSQAYDGRLPFFTMQIAAAQVGASASYWIRNYYGGKIGRATFSASEGEDLRLSLDDIIFKDIRTNTSGDRLYQSGLSVNTTSDLSEKGRFLFANASIKVGTITLARVKRFNLSIDNQLEPKYYMNNALLLKDGGLSSTSNLGHQVLSEIVEGKRSYSLDLDLDFVDSTSDFQLFQYLLNTSGRPTTPTALTGFSVEAVFYPSEGTLGQPLTIKCGVNPQNVSNASGRPAVVMESGAVNIPAAPAGYMSAAYRMNVDTIEISVPNS